MSAPGALAVMADAIRYERKAGAADSWIAELVAAHDAVAELIEISEAIAAYNPGNDKFTPFRVPSVKWERWRAALARCKGAQS